MMMRQFHLASGLSVIVVPMKGTTTTTVMMMFGVGSKYERPEQSGISHFLEHVFFKGTTKRPDTLAISSAIDSVGGELNAFTSKEYTGYYAKLDADHTELACDVLSDILLHSKFSSAELDRERKVVIEEMRLYRDTPVRYISDVFERLLYGETPAGRDIVGTERTISSFTRKDVVSYFRTHYIAANATLCFAGNISVAKATTFARSYFGAIPKGNCSRKESVQESQNVPGLLLVKKKTDQSHLSIGFRTVPVNHPDRFPLEVLSILLGGNMSSRMFIAVRGKHGLGYYVRSTSDHYSDAGYFATVAGIDNARVLDALAIIINEYKRIRNARSVPQEELRRAKEFLKGKMMIDLESSEEMASWVLLQRVLEGRVLDIDAVRDRIDRVTSADIVRVAKTYFRVENLNLAMIGPSEDESVFRKLLSTLESSKRSEVNG